MPGNRPGDDDHLGIVAKARIVITEAGVGFIPPLLKQMDFYHQEMRRGHLGEIAFEPDQVLPMTPSEYFQRNCYVGCSFPGPDEARAIRHGFPWVYADEAVLDRRTRGVSPGALAVLEDAERRLLALVTVNPNSKIVARVMDADPEARIDAAWLEARLSRALSAALAKGGGWLMGGRFTVADLNAACAVFYLRGAPDLMAAFPAAQEWYARCTAREGFREMLRLRGEA